ncbi:MAG: penicillin-binding protein [Prevotella sp.]|nr:penicillin-binding protein [Prevotella sp.]
MKKIFRKIGNMCSWYLSLYRGRRWYTRLAILATSGIVSLITWLILVDMNFLWLFGKSPGFSQIMKPDTPVASEIYSADGKLIGKYFNENRTPVKYEEVNPVFWQALIDTEDERYYRHMGIDFQGLAAALKDAAVHREARGASTITQQLAKNMFRVRTQYSTGLLGQIPGLRMLIMKSKEWIIATKLELLYDKQQILTMYANTVDFGSNAYGIKTASKTYFDTTPSELTTEQVATLVGMLKGTTLFNPLVNPERSLKRRNTVLANMLEHDDLNRMEYDSLCQQPMQLHFSSEAKNEGTANYFKEAIVKHLEKQFSRQELETQGYKIYTPLDSRLQRYAEQAVRRQMRQIQSSFDEHWSGRDPWIDESGQPIQGFIENIAQKLPLYKELSARFPNQPDSIRAALNRPHKVKLFDYDQRNYEREMSTLDSIRYMVRFMHCAFLAMEPQTGHVKAWVGDIDWNSWKYDKVTAMRQPGSTFKLFVYTEAMNQGLTPCDKRRDEPISFPVWNAHKQQEEMWTPTNAGGSFSGDSLPLKNAFARSINSVAVRLGQEMGVKRIAETAYAMGIESPLEETPSLALGSSDVCLLEMVDAYCTIANDGRRQAPVLVTRIVDRDGREIYTAPTDGDQAISYKSAFFMQQMLLGGLREPGGTSAGLWEYVGNYDDTTFGGKTGTTNNNSDGWFMGVSPRLVVGAWVGGEYRSIHFRTGALGQGARTALPICGLFLRSMLGDRAFRQYHARFSGPNDSDITPDLYTCEGYTPESSDSTDVDSLYYYEDEIVFDESGNPVVRQVRRRRELPDDEDPYSPNSQGALREEEINFDNL